MELSVEEAAGLLRITPRAVRKRLEKGELPGKKRNGRWRIAREALPLDDVERARVTARAAAVRAAVEDALPSHLGKDRSKHRSLVDLDAWRFAHALRQRVTGTPAAACLDQALSEIAEAWVVWDPGAQRVLWDRARRACSRALNVLLVEQALPPPAAIAAVAADIERLLIPAINGCLRRAEARATRATP